jgi:hypothetical protein
MNASEELRDYLARLHARLRLGAIARGAAILCGVALGVTPLLVIFANRYAFSAGSVRGSRLLLLVVLAVGALLGLAIPLWRLNRLRVIRRAEDRFPQFEERLRTFAERDADATAAPTTLPRNAFGELLAADTLRVARTARPASLVSTSLLAGLLSCGVLCVGALVWLIRAGPGYMGYGAALLWSVPRSGPLYELHVAPGDTTLRRHSDLLVTAGLVGLATQTVRLHVRIGNAAWQEVTMQPQPQSGGFRYLLSALPDHAEYYVEAGPMESPHFNAQVADVAQVKQIRVTYHFPAWTQMPDRTEDHGGDLRAVQGTHAQLSILTDQPLLHGALVLDDGHQLPLVAGAANTYSVIVPLDKDGAYHLTTVDRQHPTRISEDYFIEAGEPTAPQVAIVKPGGDYRASPIEEVTINAQAADDFGLRDFSLHYSVNGGPDQQIKLLPHAGTRQARGGAVISLESMKLVPGDVVSVYAQASDARAESRSQMVFVQADPYEREFSQSQAGGGGGGGGGGGAGEQMDISRREKEIIAGTFAQVDGRAAAAKQAEQAKFLSDVQNTLRGQAMSLTGRLQMRGLNDANEQFSGYQKEMTAAADAMTPAATKLSQSQWRDALPDEQKALQHLLRAEATFRQIQVAFGSAGGGGGGGSMGRDLASLSDLELDTQKNSYETAQSASPAQKRDEQIDAALRKLDELARKQEELAQEHPNAADAASERWQQEMLRRQAEELQRQLEQMAKNEQSGSQSGAQSGRSSQSGQSGQSGGRSGRESSAKGQGGADASGTIRQAMNRLREAQESMRRAVDQRDAAGARRAAEGLRDAMAALGGLQRNESAGHVDELARQAQQLADRARQQQQQLKDMMVPGSGAGRALRPPPNVESMIDARQQLADDVGRLEQSLRDAEREALKGNHEAASKLRDALNNLDESDVQTRLQRSADLLRGRYNPGGDSSESDIPDALAKLSEDVRQAGRASGDSPGSDEAFSAVQRFRARLAQMDGANGKPGGPGQSGSRIDPKALARGGSPSQQQGQGQGPGDAGNVTGRPGGVRTAGGGAGGFVDGGWNTGNNQYGARGAAPRDTGPTPEDRERNFDQGLADLQSVRRAVADDPAAKKQVDDLIRSMQQLDPRRFPGNPEVVDQLFAEVRSGVDRLELQLGHDPADDNRSVVRNAESLPVPEGYQDAVAEYYRRLSKGQ